MKIDTPILVATSNPHKLAEIAAVMAPLGIEVVGLDEAGVNLPEPVEDGETFEANARLKAVYYAARTGRLCLADDSGLEVEALGGRPGVQSARYAGIGATRGERDAANNVKLLIELRDIPPDRRAAQFVCAMCLADATGRVLAETRGEFPGIIIDRPRGTNGFGYDPLLLLPDVGLTSAELSPSEKNRRSHRGFAARAMAGWLLRNSAASGGA